MPEFDPEALKGIYEEYFDSAKYQQLADASRRQVVTWRWATLPMFSVRPFERELFGRTAIGRWLKEGEQPTTHHHRHGLDAEHSIQVVERARREESYWIYDDCQTTVVTFDVTSRPATDPTERSVSHVVRCWYEGQRPIRYQRFNPSGGFEDQYEWRADRLEKCVQCVWNHPYYSPIYNTWSGMSKCWFVQQTYEYDADGRLDQVWSQYINESNEAIAPRKLEYRRPRKGETIPALSASIKAMLLEQIPEAVRRAKIDAMVYCLLLCYTEEDFLSSWPPFLVVGNESQRKRIVEEGNSVNYYLWAPDEMRSHDENYEITLDDETLSETCNLHLLLMDMKGSFTPGKKILRDVACQLNTHKWSGILKTTDDFVVAAVDDTGEVDFVKDIKATIPAERFADLESRGLL